MKNILIPSEIKNHRDTFFFFLRTVTDNRLKEKKKNSNFQ